MSQKDKVVIRFDEVFFEHSTNAPVLNEASFTVREGSKITLMGQNGAGKSTLFGLITGKLKPELGEIHVDQGLSIAISKQVIPRDQLELSVREFFEKSFTEKVYAIDPKIDEVLEAVNLKADKEKQIKDFSGGQQARLLLASALIQKPDILLLDEPTNNLDKAGIDHLKKFLQDFKNTVIVISHDADFLNSFTEGVLYLNVYTKKIEQYVGNYIKVVRDITAQIEKEKRKNAQYEKHIQEKKDKANFFANKGGRMRVLARRMRESAEEAEEAKVDVRRDDKTIREFEIGIKENHIGDILRIESLSIMGKNGPVDRMANVSLRKDQHLLLTGPNGIGKSTLLESLAQGTNPGAIISPGVRVGYYRQDFSTLNFESTVYQTLREALNKDDEHVLRSVAAGFLLTKEVIGSKIGTLSEGQKGLVAFAQLTLLQPTLLILDEPTNHINFRHLPVIAKALDNYKGAMVLVSHVPEFVSQIRIDETLDLEKLKPVPKNK